MARVLDDMIDAPDLQGVPRTLLATLAARAIESSRPDALLRDPCAEEIYQALDGSPAFLLGMSEHDRVATVLRARQFDRFARIFQERYPGGLIVDIGCGLDTRFQRLDDGELSWLGIDLPGVVELRRRWLRDSVRCHCIGQSMFDLSWVSKARDFRKPAIFVAEGVFPYFSTAQVRPLVEEIVRQFPGGELIFDAASPLLARLHNLSSSVLHETGTKVRWDSPSPRSLEAWGLRLLEEWYYFDRPEPRLGLARWLRYFPVLGKASGIFRYRLS
jgi:O-methyltransferase involved in polyketide biosynthesis